MLTGDMLRRSAQRFPAKAAIIRRMSPPLRRNSAASVSTVASSTGSTA